MSSVCRPDRVADRDGDGDGDGDEDGVGALPKSCSWAQSKREKERNPSEAEKDDKELGLTCCWLDMRASKRGEAREIRSAVGSK